jgi:DNA-binding NarL/FixJ family response regulator
MPGMGGIEAARLIAERHPEAVVVLLSAAVPAEVGRSTTLGKVIVDKRSLSPGLLRAAWDQARSEKAGATAS